jgi:RNA polymerase sigma factor (sigma-70 family)
VKNIPSRDMMPEITSENFPEGYTCDGKLAEPGVEIFRGPARDFHREEKYLEEPRFEFDFNSVNIRERMAEIYPIMESKLNEQEQMIINLVHKDGFNFPEIGKLLDITRSAVQRAYSKAVKKIKTEIERRKRLL